MCSWILVFTAPQLLYLLCADTHTYNWGNPAGQEQGVYKAQRAEAMDFAAKFMRPGN
jgi:hypothetical protein